MLDMRDFRGISYPFEIVGRSYMYGLAVAGEAGVDCVIRSLLSDLSTTLGLSGYKSLSDVQGQAASGVLFKEVN